MSTTEAEARGILVIAPGGYCPLSSDGPEDGKDGEKLRAKSGDETKKFENSEKKDENACSIMLRSCSLSWDLSENSEEILCNLVMYPRCIRVLHFLEITKLQQQKFKENNIVLKRISRLNLSISLLIIAII